MCSVALKYSAERDAKETREKKEKQLKRIEEARKRAEEPKGGQSEHYIHVCAYKTLYQLFLLLPPSLPPCFAPSLLPSLFPSSAFGYLPPPPPPQDEKDSQDPGFVEKLITQMIRNVQITVKNIHIHYEDAVSTPSPSLLLI